MLTKTDLSQIRKVVREEVGNEVQATKDELSADISMSRIRVQKDINDLKDRMKNSEIRAAKMHQELKAEIKTVVHFLDTENLKTAKRVKKIEEQLQIPPLS